MVAVHTSCGVRRDLRKPRLAMAPVLQTNDDLGVVTAARAMSVSFCRTGRYTAAGCAEAPVGFAGSG
jgi:hypothetical protein